MCFSGDPLEGNASRRDPGRKVKRRKGKRLDIDDLINAALQAINDIKDTDFLSMPEEAEEEK